MKAFRRSRHQFVAVFSADEAGTLSLLASQLSDLLENRSSYDSDPALLRLLPDAYPDDAEASAEFRRFTADDLAVRKSANARRIVADLAPAIGVTSATVVKVDAQAAQAWVRSLTDIRLTIAARLGIETDDDVESGDAVVRDLYDWLGFVQGSLVECLDR
ncbi:DUF2017 domain-containing protein [Frigoribacterium sp. CG_9.8]|uniref:DUF2017 domain-containing protein n=1 Tax=Frigoribacterium sp. CG_9.8 TaxID=2787733 RepID=UPI0018C94715|nr:DUF2017 domain-containing protein [Frigoribacterium sp. CG_9.8]MBG6107152.1 hypothetical protein [Frigoribacterium sp. CG_9.8]